jgi:hypothetical protein
VVPDMSRPYEQERQHVVVERSEPSGWTQIDDTDGRCAQRTRAASVSRPGDPERHRERQQLMMASDKIVCFVSGTARGNLLRKRVK